MKELVAELQQAIRTGSRETVINLINENPDLVNEPDERGFTPLIMAAYFDQLEILKSLLEKGARINDVDGAGNTALMGAVFKGYPEIVRYLLNKGASTQAKNINGANVMTYAAAMASQKSLICS